MHNTPLYRVNMAAGSFKKANATTSGHESFTLLPVAFPNKNPSEYKYQRDFLFNKLEKSSFR
jgi:hypothetical protein